MDPLSITVSCITLVTAVGNLSLKIHAFIREVRDARGDLDSISKELGSLRTVLELLSDDASTSDGSGFPPSLVRQISGILTNCAEVLVHIDASLVKHSGGGVKKAVKWSIAGRDDMNKLRSSLEAHKSALDIALDMVALSMTREIKANTQEIKNDTSAIKDDTTQILAEIAKLQARLPEHEKPQENNNFTLKRYLDSMTSYAETVCDLSDNESDSAVDLCAQVETIKLDDASASVLNSQLNASEESAPNNIESNTRKPPSADSEPSPWQSKRFRHVSRENRISAEEFNVRKRTRALPDSEYNFKLNPDQQTKIRDAFAQLPKQKPMPAIETPKRIQPQQTAAKSVASSSKTREILPTKEVTSMAIPTTNSVPFTPKNDISFAYKQEFNQIRSDRENLAPSAGVLATARSLNTLGISTSWRHRPNTVTGPPKLPLLLENGIFYLQYHDKKTIVPPQNLHLGSANPSMKARVLLSDGESLAINNCELGVDPDGRYYVVAEDGTKLRDARTRIRKNVLRMGGASYMSFMTSTWADVESPAWKKAVAEGSIVVPRTVETMGSSQKVICRTLRLRYEE